MTDQVRVFEEQAGTAGGIVALFAAVVALLRAVSPPTPAQLSQADPLVQLAASWFGVSAIPLVAIIAPIGWWFYRRPGPAAWRVAATQGAMAVAAIAVATPLLRFAVGPALPAFIPPEESARPGMALGLCAALLEEGVFRLAILAVPYAAWRRRSGNAAAAAVMSILLTAAVLALVHELGPGAGEFHPQYFVSRFVVLGCFMGALFIWVGPAFLVTAHCTAHLAIPLMFPGISS